MLINILNKLYEHSGKYIDVKYDFNLPIPAYSFVDLDINDRLVPTISLNPNLYPKDNNVIAHILSHEWGHHTLNHIKAPTDPSFDIKKIQDKNDRQLKEDEADSYASNFIKEFFYDKEPIIDFIRNSSPNDFKHRINILLKPLKI